MFNVCKYGPRVNDTRIIDSARSSGLRMRDVRHAIHVEPELGLANPSTMSTIAGALEHLDLDVRRGRGDTTWLTAEIRGDRPGPTVLLRADTDALPITEEPGTDSSRRPGVMHACGHDAHAAMLVGAACVLHEHRHQLSGRIVLLFQPGEEGHFGAEHCLRDDAVDMRAVDAAFGIHIDPRMPAGVVATKAGALLAGSVTFEITVHGVGGHGSEPHLGVDPVTIACEIAVALQVAATRTLDPFDPGVLTVTKVSAGTTRNVMPAVATLLGTARFFTDTTEHALVELLERVPRGIAASHRAGVTVALTPGYRPTVNDGRLTTFATEVVGEVIGRDRVRLLDRPRMGSEDFSVYLQHVPGVFFMLGVCPPQRDAASAPPLHSAELIVDDEAMVIGAAVHATLALAYAERHGS
jgi:amidohydrolase